MSNQIQILAPKQGVSQSAMVGFADIRNIDIHSVQGITLCNNIMSKVSATTIVGQIKWLVRHPITSAEIYALDDGGKVYRSGDSGATWALMTGFTAGGHGNGLAIFKNYLIVARDAYLDICGDGAASGNGTTTGIANANWSNSWKAIDSDVLWHPMITSKNDSKLYGGAGRFVFSLDENTGQTFAPGTAGTFTYTQQALDLPVNYRIKCIEELGNNLMLGTWQGTAVTDIRIADLFPWDRSSVSFGQPVVIDDFGIHALKNDGNSLIVLAGISGTIRRCDGSNAYIVGQIPNSVCNLTGTKYLEFYPGSIMTYKNKTFFGIGENELGVDGIGIWSLLQTGKGNIMTLEHQISNFGVTANTGVTQIIKVSALLAVTKSSFLAGWRDNTTYGLDLTGTSYAYATDYSASFTTPLYIVGTNLNQRKITELEWSLSKPLRTGEGIKIEYRTNLTMDFVEVETWAYADVNVGAIVSKNLITELPNDIKTCELIQLRISLKGTATTSPEFRSLILK